MKTNTLNRGEFVNEKVSRLIELSKEMEILQNTVEDLGDNVALDIIDGWTTGDEVLDFVLVACNGEYDTFTLEMQYKPLFNLGLRRPGQRILVIQKAQHYRDYDLCILRNIYMARLRPEETVFNVNSQSIHLPVEPNFLVWQEFLHDNLIMQGHKTVNEKWLKTGVLHSEYSQFGNTNVDKDGLVSVPYDSVCDIEILPIDDEEFFFEVHGIDTNLFNVMYKTWREYNVK